MSVSINELVFTGGGAGGGSSSFIGEAFDHIVASYPNATTEVYVYKIGGSNGTTVATITVVYTTSEKLFLATFDRV